MPPRLLRLAILTATWICTLSRAAPPEGKPVLLPLWKKTTAGIEPADDLYHEQFAASREVLLRRYASFIAQRREFGRPLIPPGVPVAVRDFVVVANDRAIALFALRKTEVLSTPVAQGGRWWYQDLDNCFQWMLKDLGRRTMTEQWITQLRLSDSAELIFNRTLCRALSVGDDDAYFVDELAFLPAPVDPKKPVSAGIFTEPIGRNSVKSVNLETGKLVLKMPATWRSEKAPTPTIFLAAPLTTKDEWYVLSDRDGSVHLSKISLQKWLKLNAERSEDLDSRAQLWDREIVKVALGAQHDTRRRIHAIHLVQAGDLILCPTHLGRVVAVEAKTGRIKWTHEYAPLDAKRFPTFAPEWVVVPPVVVGDKYIYAPADFPELLCLNVADGKKVWSVKKGEGDGLYPAVVGEQVLVVGEKTLRSLNLKDGSEQWKLDLPGLPCGRGAMLGDKYLLPVSEPKTWRGMIALVDVKAGKITEVLKPDKDEPIGNLVVHQEFLISQTLTEIAVFPIRK